MSMAIWTGIRLEVEIPQVGAGPGETFFILLEDGFDLLQEDGSKFLLEAAP